MNWLLSPLAWLLIGGGLVLLACGLRRFRVWTIGAGMLMGATALASMTPVGANLLVRSLERPVQSPPECLLAPPATAVVLGGGIEGWPRSRADFSVLNLSSRRRMDGAVAWWRERQGRTVVTQGGAPYPGAIPIAELMAAYARAHGVPESALRVEARSGDTWGNAEQAALLSPSLPRRIVLVTSLLHLPRARQAFASAGFEVCPLGTDSRMLPSRLPWALVPRASALANAEDAVHEWVGAAYYRWRARGRGAAPEP